MANTESVQFVEHELEVNKNVFKTFLD